MNARAIVINGLLILTALLTVIPLLWMLSASFMPTGQATFYPPRLLPSQPTLEHYRELFTRMKFGATPRTGVPVALRIRLSLLTVAFVICITAAWLAAKLAVQ